MHTKTSQRIPLSLVHWTGLASVVTAGLLLTVNWQLSVMELLDKAIASATTSMQDLIGEPVLNRLGIVA